jgi:hypothetical protein
MEFNVDCTDNPSISPEGNDSSAVFKGMSHSGSPSLHAILEESVDEDDLTMSEGGSSDFPIFWDCNVVTPIVNIATTPPPKGTAAPLPIPMVPQRTAMPQPEAELLPELPRAYQVE